MQQRWVAATLPVVQHASAGGTATAGDIPSWFLHRPCPNEIREDLTPANQCFPPAAETGVRSHCTVPVCHTGHPRRANRLWTIELDSPQGGRQTEVCFLSPVAVWVGMFTWQSIRISDSRPP